MLSANNILSPAHGSALATPTQDMVLGAYYLTYSDKDLNGMTAEKIKLSSGFFGMEVEGTGTVYHALFGPLGRRGQAAFFSLAGLAFRTTEPVTSAGGTM